MAHATTAGRSELVVKDQDLLEEQTYPPGVVEDTSVGVGQVVIQQSFQWLSRGHGWEMLFQEGRAAQSCRS